MESKADVLSKFKEYYQLVTNRFNRGITRLRCDRGSEYMNNNFRDFCTEKGIHFEPSIRNCLQQNCKAERLNRTLVERARTLIYESNLEKVYWSEAITVN